MFVLLCITFLIICNYLDEEVRAGCYASLSSLCLVTVRVMWLYLAIPYVGLQSVIAVFRDRTSLTFRLGSGTRMINTPVCLISLSLVGSEHSAYWSCVQNRGTWKSDPYIHIQFNNFTSSQAFVIKIWKLANKPFFKFFISIVCIYLQHNQNFTWNLLYTSISKLLLL